VSQRIGAAIWIQVRHNLAFTRDSFTSPAHVHIELYEMFH